MIKDVFYIKSWKVTILYECTYDDIDYIIETLKQVNCPKIYIKEALNNLETCSLNTGLTYSNIKLKSSIIVINKTSSFAQLINTVSHEFYHLICHISKALKIKDQEELAYLNGKLNMQSYIFVENLKNKVTS